MSMTSFQWTECFGWNRSMLKRKLLRFPFECFWMIASPTWNCSNNQHWNWCRCSFKLRKTEFPISHSSRHRWSMMLSNEDTNSFGKLQPSKWAMKKHWLFRVFKGFYYPLMWDYDKPLDIVIPIKQHFMESIRVFFSCLKCRTCSHRAF